MDVRTSSLHPLLTIAAISVILFSLVGIAFMTGVLPRPEPALATPAEVAAVTPAPEATPAAAATAGENTTTPATASPAPSATKVASRKSSSTSHRTASTSRSSGESSQRVASSDAVTPHEAAYEREPAAAGPSCWNCGTVVAINTVATQAKPSGIGAVAGAVIGGVIGHQFGGGDGKKVATAAGAIGGAMAGNEVERQRSSQTQYSVTVRMDSGSTRSFSYAAQPALSKGDKVRVEGDTLVPVY